MEKSPLRAIRQHCLECSCGSAYEVKNCVIHDCELYPFRMGHNPNRKSSLSDEQRKEVERNLNLAVSQINQLVRHRKIPLFELVG